MNAFNYDLGRKCLIAEGWCPAKQLDNVRAALRTATSKAGASVAPIMNEIHTEMEPPTYYITTEFTNAFQEIVNAYGVARYGK
jgi:V-type H+-transporting ATPase subunit a